MDPTGPAQPSQDTAYSTSGNPADQTGQERSQAATNDVRAHGGSLVESRERGDVPVPSSHSSGATSTSLGYGARDSSGDRTDIAPGASDTEGEQMRAPGEGDVYRQQFHKTGFGEQADLASDLDRKKAEQAPLREEVAERREKDVDVGGAIGGRGGPAVVEGR